MPRLPQWLPLSLRRLLGADGPVLPLDEAAQGLRSLYWELRDAPDFLHDTALTGRAHLLGKSLAVAATRADLAATEKAAELEACAAALLTWPAIAEPFDGLVFEGSLTRETASVVALTAMRRAEACLPVARAAVARPRPSAPPRLRPT